MEDVTAIVAGAGPAGLAAATLLAQGGVRTALVSPPPAGGDTRTVALMLPSLRLLAHIGVWPGGLRDSCSPLRVLRLVDDTGGAFAPPPISFRAAEIGEEAFGWNIPLSMLTPALEAAARAAGVAFIDAKVAALRHGAARLSDGRELAARVILAADGRQSAVRAEAGIRAIDWAHDQSAIATSFSHSRPHQDTSTEHHRRGGPFTTVPLPDGRSSLVWMEAPARAAELMALGDRAFAAEIQLASHGSLGAITATGPRKLFPMRGLAAQSLAANRVLLIGEAAHVSPPVGAQGLNMSLRDAAEAAHLILDAMADGEDPGGAAVMTAYAAARRGDVAPRQFTIDLMNRSMLADLAMIDAARGLALTMVDRIGPLRRAIMKQGLGPARLPLAMQA